ncbi:MAG: acylphosphatase [Betaproteobacteria bacterium]|nr:acylphosphatase [Betaproteobacteria bacterium]
MNFKHLDIHVFGIVQGVSFRAHTRDQAESLGLTGYVCNEPDDTVYIEAEGAEEDLACLVRWCHQGPPLAEVERVDVSEGPLKRFPDFRIAWGRQV